MSSYIIEHESDAQEIKASLKRYAERGFDFPQSLRKAGVSEFEWNQMGYIERHEFLGAWLSGKTYEEKFLY